MKIANFVIGCFILLGLTSNVYASSPEDILEYQFKAASLRQQALQPRTHDFERLEFLGDRVLGLATAHLLYNHSSQKDVGWLSESFAKIVSKDGLYKIYLYLDIDIYELASHSYQVPDHGIVAKKTATDIVEALLAAVYIDGGYQSAQTVCENLLKKFYKLKQKDSIDHHTTLSTLQTNKIVKKCEDLQDAFSYFFKDISLLHEAFRHSSVGGTLFKKLNFVGIHVLNLYLATRIFEDNQTGAEELFVQFFERMTNNDKLEAIFQTWKFWKFLERQSNGSSLSSSTVPTRMAVDTVRAFIGSVYLDGGYEAVKPILFHLLYAQPSTEYSITPRITLDNHKMNSLTNQITVVKTTNCDEWPDLIGTKAEISSKEVENSGNQCNLITNSHNNCGTTYLKVAQTVKTPVISTIQSKTTEEWPALTTSPPLTPKTPKWPNVKGPLVNESFGKK